MEFALLDSSLASVQDFLTMPLSSFGTVMDIMCHYVLETCNWVLFYRKFQIRMVLSLGRDFGFLNCVKTMKDWGDFEVGLNAFCLVKWLQVYGR